MKNRLSRLHISWNQNIKLVNRGKKHLYNSDMNPKCKCRKQTQILLQVLFFHFCYPYIVYVRMYMLRQRIR